MIQPASRRFRIGVITFVVVSLLMLGVGIVFGLIRIVREAPMNRSAGLDPVGGQKETASSSRTAIISDSGITLAKFERLKTGMSYSDAVAVLGSAGVESSRADLGGVTTVMYTWKASAGFGNMNAMFQNGRLVSKAQFGLE